MRELQDNDDFVYSVCCDNYWILEVDHGQACRIVGRPVFWLKFSSSGLPFFVPHLLDVFDIGFCSFESFALSFLWVSPSISHCFSASILAPPHEIVGGCWYIAVDTLSTLGTHFILYLRLSSRRLQDDK